MKFFDTLSSNKKDIPFYYALCLSAFMLSLAFCVDTPLQVLQGFWIIISSPAGLITDSILIGGLGAAFFNAGLVLLYSIFLLRWAKVPFSGISIACLFLMAGFSLFGKDIWNIQPFILGGWLYSRYKKEPFSRYIYTTLFGTTLCPVASEVGMILDGFVAVIAMVLVGVAIGFLIPPIAVFSVRAHQGYNLYNVGFAAGLLGMIFASLCKSFGYEFQTQSKWSSGNNFLLGGWLAFLFLFTIAAGLLLEPKWKNYPRMFRHSGRLIADFVLLDGIGFSLINMGVVGCIGLATTLLTGNQINGPTMGGIFTMCGFAAFGKHPKNILPVMFGVLVSTVIMVHNLQDPSVVLAALFGTALAPIAGQFGWKWGIVAGIIHSCVVLNVGGLHGWMNLYNNGFAAGLVCIVLVPLIEAIRNHNTTERRTV